MIIILTVAVTLLIVFVLGIVGRLEKVKEELKELREEQNRQNEDAIFLLQSRIETAKVIVQHTEVLKFLLDECMQEGNIPYPLMGPMGEA